MRPSRKSNEMRKTAEEAHHDAVELQAGVERIALGPYTSYSLRTDPKHLCFVLSRYKFCAKVLAGKKEVLEIGCGDAIGLPIVAQAVGHLWAVDWDARKCLLTLRIAGAYFPRQQDKPTLAWPIVLTWGIAYGVCF